jgi:H+-transporting ATPase
MAPANPPNGDVENGKYDDKDKADAPRTSGNFAGGLVLPNDGIGETDEGEYGNLVRYISQYKDGRRASTVSAHGDDAGKKPWWKFWGGKKGENGLDGFETPEEWLETNLQRGLASGEVETRRKKTGWNELVTEKENMFLTFLSYFQGPILYGECIPWFSDASLRGRASIDGWSR